MKFLQVLAFGLLASLFAIISCSNGMQNYYNGGGTQCTKGVDPLPNDVTGTPGMTKVGEGDNIVLSKNTAGTYVYQGADAVFNDSNGMLVQVNIRPDNNQISQVNRTCVDGMAQFDRKSVHFSDFLPGLRFISTDAAGKPNSILIENIGYLYSSTGIAALTPVNCDLSGDPQIPPTLKDNPDKCGTLNPASIKSAKVTSIGSLFPRPGPNDKLTVWCQDINPGSCADPNAAKTYNIRYLVTRHPGHLPSDGTTKVEYSVSFTWTPTPAVPADVTQTRGM